MDQEDDAVPATSQRQPGDRTAQRTRRLPRPDESITVVLERGKTGLTYATSPDFAGLLTCGEDIPSALRAAASAYEELAAALPEPQDASRPSVTPPIATASVRIHIAVAVTPMGDWEASGSGAADGDYDSDAGMRAREALGDGEFSTGAPVFWLWADVPIPSGLAQGIEAHRAETGTGSVHESPIGNADASS